MFSSFSLHLSISVAIILLQAKDAPAFSSSSLWQQHHHHHQPPLPSTLASKRVGCHHRTARSSSSSLTILPAALSSLSLLNATLAKNDEVSSYLPLPLEWDNAFATQAIQDLEAVTTASTTGESRATATMATSEVESKRLQLKRELAHSAITSFHPDATQQALSSPSKTAEDIMKELENISPLPILRPALHHSLNAHWSFVFTGVPTIGMRLITLLSRISVMFPFEILDFRDVALCVTDDNSKAKALVEVQVCGAWEVLLEVCTSLRRPTFEDLQGEYASFKDEQGTLLLEHFQGIRLNGVELPTPQSWHTTRTLEITYMDKDIMIARTSGGEPHLLLRNSPLCYSPEEMMVHGDDASITTLDEEIVECSIDDDGKGKWTEFFSEAIELYGERITRCLVDRDFGREAYDAKNKKEGNDHEWWKALADRGIDLGNPWGIGKD